MSAADFLTIAEASRRIAAGELSPVDLTRACLERIERLDGTLNSFVLVLADEALEAASAAEAEIRSRGPRGPLHGIPVALKDIYETAGVRTTGHSRTRLDYVPAEDATATRKLGEAGAILLGKLATHEFAIGGPSFDIAFPPARNPWQPEHFTGGSSSGSGAAVAAGLCLGALGTDSGGSIRGPAALCGIAGIKPTYGRVSRAGVFPLSYTMDHCGPMAWTAEDCALMLAAIAGPDGRDPTASSAPVPDYRAALNGDISGLRVGVARNLYEDDQAATPEVQGAIEAALDQLAALGATVEEITLSPRDRYHACGMVIILAEAFAVHQRAMLDRPREFGELCRHKVALGALIDAPDYVQATRLRRHLAAEMEAALERCDVLLSAIMFAPAPPIHEVPKWNLIENSVLAMPANISGHPAMSVCCGFSDGGLPLGLQIIGRRFDEATLLRVADAYERATPWRRRRPEL